MMNELLGELSEEWKLEGLVSPGNVIGIINGYISICSEEENI